MYGITAICILLLGIEFYMARDEPDFDQGILLGPFFRIAHRWYRLLSKRGLFSQHTGGKFRDITQCLERLHPGEQREALQKAYYVKKIALSQLVCLAGVLFGFLMNVKGESSRQIVDGAITRGNFGEEPLVVSLVEGQKKTQPFVVQVQNQTLQEEQLDQMFAAFCQTLPQRIKGKNESLDAVVSDLVLEESYEAYPFIVEWRSECPDMLTDTGVVEETQQKQQVKLHVIARYGQWEREEIVTVGLIAPVWTAEEKRHKDLQQLLLDSEEQSRGEQQWILPTTYEGQTLSFTQVVADEGIWVMGAFLGVAVVLFVVADKDLRDQLEKRKKNISRAYPEVVHKLVLYLGAGLTVRGSIQRLAANRRQERGKERELHPVYEELLYACRELQTGISENVVYEHLGRRLGVQEYVRLTTLLSQNLKKGNATLLQRLQEEAQRSKEQHLQYAKKVGEEAGTKLLVPMVLLLLVVMIVLLLPAFGTVGI